MKNNSRDNIIRTIWLIVDIVIWLLSIMVLIYKNSNMTLLTICGILNILSYFINIDNYKIMGLISVISAYFATGDIWQGISLGLAIWKVLSYIYLTFSYICAKNRLK